MIFCQGGLDFWWYENGFHAGLKSLGEEGGVWGVGDLFGKTAEDLPPIGVEIPGLYKMGFPVAEKFADPLAPRFGVAFREDFLDCDQNGFVARWGSESEGFALR